MAELRLVGRVLTPAEEVERAVVVVRDGWIVAVTPGDGPADLDAGDGWIAPGLIDLQVNGAFGEDFSEPAADVAKVAARLPAFGATAFLPTIVTSPPKRYPACLANVRRALGAPGARVLGAHLEGPWLAERYRGAHQVAYLRPPDLAEAASWLAAGPLRMVTLAPELPGALDAITSLTEASVVVALGHSGATYEEARAGIAAGARHGTHLYNAMPPLHHRAPGLTGALLSEPGVTAGIIPDGVHVHPAAFRVALRALGPGRLCLVTDMIAATGLPPGRVTLAGAEVISDGVSARLPEGTLAGSILTPDRAVANVAAWTGDLRAAVEMMTLTPACILGLADEIGRVASGCRADLVILGPDLRVRQTLIGGELHPPFPSR